jgi:hypothetical protein
MQARGVQRAEVSEVGPEHREDRKEGEPWQHKPLFWSPERSRQAS